MRRTVATFLVTLGLSLGLFVLPLRLVPPEWSAPIVFGSLIALGAAASLVGRGLLGLLAFYLGYATAHLVAIGLGLFLPPGEEEILEWLLYLVIFSLAGTVGYLGPVLVRALRRLARRPS